MSWAKRRGQTTPSPAAGPPPVQMYNPNQHSNTETQWQQSGAQSHDNWYGQNTQTQPQQANNYWQQPSYTNQQQQQQPPPAPQTYNQPPQQFQYQEQSGYYQNNTPYQQQQQQPYGNLQYSQQYNQNNLYGNQQPQQQQQQLPPQQPTEGDGWGNWGWGDEDNSNVQNLPQQPAQQPQNPNAISDSFANDETWNWSLEDSSKQPNTGKASRNENLTVDQVTGKRGKLETPQWSVESQVSQESSDDILQTSESDKSHMLSRSSTISHSPIGHDLQPCNHDDLQLRDGMNSLDPSPGAPPSVQHVENKEIVSQQRQEKIRNDPTPPPHRNNQTPPLPRGSAQKSSSKFPRTPTVGSSDSNRQPSTPTLFPTSFHNHTVNLETLPDNSEQPDPVVVQQHQPSSVARKTSPQQWAENNEAPINDRNQYLETGQLSDVDLSNFNQGAEGLNVDDTLPLPPPGLSRMVLGQFEQPENNPSQDEPPPGLSRMVPGQVERNPNPPILIPDNLRQPFEPIDPPEGLRRMIPGESSSPESSTRQLQSYQPQVDSEPELNEMGAHEPRSATIGADTPPATLPPPPQKTSANRSETIGADTSPDPPKSSTTTNQDNPRNRGTSSSSGGASGKRGKKSRRDSIEGQIQDGDVGALASSVRNLTVVDDDDDDDDVKGRKHNKESSDSEREGRGKSPRHDRRYNNRDEKNRDRDRNRGRYSPEYRERGYDKRRYRDSRRYEQDTDYFSDKEKERRPKDDGREYDRKYSSLRKDKDKDKDRKRRDDRRDYGRDVNKKGEYYYERYDEDYNNESKSRASSRSDSLHESYRERDRDRERGHAERDRRDRRHRDNRDKERHHGRRQRGDAFNPYNQGYGYDAYNQYYQQYHYYENLRKTNPQAYAQIYRKYYQNASGEAPTYGGEDRASVHSGRSSANDELAKDRYTRQSYYSQTSLPHLGGYYRDSQTHSISGHYGLDDSSFGRPYDQTDTSLTYDDSHMATQRLTPAKFSTAHAKASISSGKLVKILPHYPLDGETPTVEVCSLEVLLRNDEDYQELKQFPGPLVKGVTHKKTIIEYCENKIKDAAFNLEIIDADSYVLMWELLILLIRQNGMVVGTDIAELLLKNQPLEPVQRSASVISSIGSNQAAENSPEVGNGQVSASGSLKEEEVTNKFREYLLYGSGKEALEWAMKHGLWGHALFLASKLDKRTYANVLMRFANGLTMNDPLQTLYQLLSGKVPAAVTCIADEKWGDWRPHLAMILSNSTQRPELNRKAITTLGDTLLGRGSLYAAQFCYLMAEVGFGRHGNPDTKLVLLGSDHNKSFAHFATNEAIHMTEIYEYACSLNDDNFTLVEFQRYKHLLATRLADVGLLEKALSYLEKIANFIVKNPTVIEGALVREVTVLADKLKFYDPVGDADDDTAFGVDLDSSRPDNSWLKDLRSVQNDLNIGALTYQNSAPVVESDQSQVYGQDGWQQQSQIDQYQQQSQQWGDNQVQEVVNPLEYQQQQQQPQEQQQVQSDGYVNQYQDPLLNNQQQQQFWPQQQVQQQQWGGDQSVGYPEGNDHVNQQQRNAYDLLAHAEPEEVEKELSQPEDVPQPVPQISMPNQQKGKSPYDDEPLPNENAKVPAKAKSPEGLQGDKAQGNGWFGGIFSKLSLKPKNQMKLPDDKNPSIVWDPEKKRWVNTLGDTAGDSHDFKPPPKMADIMPKMAAPTPQQQIPQTFNQPAFSNHQINNNPTNEVQQPEVNGNPTSKPPLPNMFKLQRGRNLKKSYIDVFNPNGKAPSPLPNLGGGQQSSGAPQMNFFVPQQVHDPNAPMDFLTPAPPLQYDENAQHTQ